MIKAFQKLYESMFWNFLNRILSMKYTKALQVGPSSVEKDLG